MKHGFKQQKKLEKKNKKRKEKQISSKNKRDRDRELLERAILQRQLTLRQAQIDELESKDSMSKMVFGSLLSMSNPTNDASKQFNSAMNLSTTGCI